MSIWVRRNIFSAGIFLASRFFADGLNSTEVHGESDLLAKLIQEGSEVFKSLLCLIIAFNLQRKCGLLTVMNHTSIGEFRFFVFE